MKRIFVGSSKEEEENARRVGSWLDAAGHEAVCWVGHDRLGDDFLQRLVATAQDVDGAVFLCGEDDLAEVRGEMVFIPRDNVIFEYGLFMGYLGAKGVSIVCIGDPKLPSDFRHIVHGRMPAPADGIAEGTGDAGSPQDPHATVEERLQAWAMRLPPAYFYRLSDDLAHHLAGLITDSASVEDILLSQAPDLVTQNPTSEIRALCSEKGTAMRPYYEHQFGWAGAAPDRRIRRVFVRSSIEPQTFPEAERAGIVMHHDARDQGVCIRWIEAREEGLRGPYTHAFGFALFGDSWLVHWGAKHGTFYNAKASMQEAEHRANRVVLDLLSIRFETIWRKATPFSDSEVEALRP